MKKLLLLLLLIFPVIGYAETDADRNVATSLKYVNDKLSTKQDEIGAQSGTKAVTYTNERGAIGAREVTSNLGTSTSDKSLPMVGGVNTKLDTKQNEIPAKNTNTVLTYTGTAGQIGEKGIYDDTGTYAAQQDNLIDAGTFNAALKNGLDNEFVCAGYSPTGECWLWSIGNTSNNTTQQSYVSAVGTGIQDGTPTPTNPIYPVFYRQGDMVLRRVGDYADSYDATTGKITRRVGVKVLDGTEDWARYNAPTAFNYSYVLHSDDRLPGLRISLCSHFKNVNYAWEANMGGDGFFSDHASFDNWYFDITQYATTNSFKQWLAQQYTTGTPVTIYYALATPVEETWNKSTYTANVYVPQNQ